MDKIIEYEVPEFITCNYHGDWSWAAYYSDREMIEMIDSGHIDCPLCMASIVGIEA